MIVDFLEDFSVADQSQAGLESVSNLELRRRSRAEYDRGYQAGWSDSAAEEKTRQKKASIQLSQALQEASFTYFEARNHILVSMRPVLEELASKFLPELARKSLAPLVAEKTLALAEELETPLKIMCAPQSLDVLQEACKNSPAPPAIFLAEPSLTDLQVVFEYADGSAEIDLSHTIQELTNCVEQFYEALEDQEVKHG